MLLFTSESVARGHPDKLADQISDAVLDDVVGRDPEARVACEVALKTGIVLLFGEITTSTTIDYPGLVRRTLADAGYEDPRWGFCAENVGVISAIESQSPDIARGVDERPGKELGAGDQGMMVGYACRETPQLMPAPIQWAHALARGLEELRVNDELPYLGPDGKTQVTVEYDERTGAPRRVDTVVVSAQHAEKTKLATIRADLREQLVARALPEGLVDRRTVVHINPTGRFVIGGPRGDAGLTGRKTIVDTYGGMCRHGGGAFSGKDPTKVDRSASYLARFIAKNVVAAGLADRFEIQLAYAIGVADPVSVRAEMFGTEHEDPQRILRAIRTVFPLTPQSIIDALNLRRPIYRPTAYYGHFGRDDPDFTWERTDRAEALRAAL